MFLIGIPLLLIPFAIYNVAEFLVPGNSVGEFWTRTLFELPMMSGASWALTRRARLCGCAGARDARLGNGLGTR